MKWAFPSQAIEELCKQQTKNPIYVHYIRQTCPGFHNRSHRRAITHAWGETLIFQITNIDPMDTPWVQPAPSIVGIWDRITNPVKNALNALTRPVLGRDVFDVGSSDTRGFTRLVSPSKDQEVE